MTDLTDFLLARIAEDEAVARSAEPGPWTADGGEVWAGHPSHSVVDYARGGGATADHIARHDPARVFAECDAKRRLITTDFSSYDMESDYGEGHDAGVRWAHEGVLRLLALPYADHPEYREEWKP